MFVELHILQNFAPSCLNRDDTGSPKACFFGGHRRARVSSQCFKRATRRSETFSSEVGDLLGVRTRLLASEIRKAVEAQDFPEDVKMEAITQILRAMGIKTEDSGKTAVLLFLAPAEIEQLCASIAENFTAIAEHVQAEKGKKKPKAATVPNEITSVLRNKVTASGAVDIALFGRMISELEHMNVDGACQVAHAISTHAVAPEMDFYTAMDDLQPEADPGAGMMGVVEFNSACLYRYAAVDISQLATNLDGDRALATRAANGFCKAFVAAMPNGKQNAMAAHNPPSFVRATVREGGSPISLANAFSRPVQVTGARPDLMENSIAALVDYNKELAAMYGVKGITWEGVSSMVHVDGVERIPLERLWNGLESAVRAEAT